MPLRPTLALLALASTSLAVLPAGEAPAPAPAPAPVAVPPAGLALPAGDMAAVIIPNLPSLVAHLEHTVNAVRPGTLAPGQLAQVLGANIGDPTLQSFAGGPVVAVIAPGLPPTGALILPAKDPAATAAALQALNKQASVVGGMVVVADNAQGAALGAQTVPLIPSLTKTPVAGDCRFLVAPQIIATTYGPLLPLVLGSLGQLRGPHQTPAQAEALQKVLRAELAVALAVARDTALSVTDLRLGDQGIGIAHEAHAEAGKPLATVLVAPTAAARAALPAMAGRVGAGDAVLAMTTCMAMKPLGAYVRQLVADQPDVAAIADDVPATFAAMCDHLVGAQALVARPDAQGHVRMSSSTAIDDVAAAHTARQAFYVAFAKIGLNAATGSKAVFTPNSTTVTLPGAGTVPVDTFANTITLPNGTTASPFAPFLMADIPGASIQAQETAALVKLAGPPGAPLTTHAEASLGAGGDGYIDCDLAALVTAQLQFMAALQTHAAGTPVPEMTVHPSGGNELLAKWSLRDGTARAELYLPLATVTTIATAIQQMIQQNLQHGMGRAGGGEPAHVAPPPQF